jgi:FKBP-type peptidyl-prolyl cis-trans isomerase
MRSVVVVAAALAAFATARADAPKGEAPKAAPAAKAEAAKPDLKRTLHAVGLAVSKSLDAFDLAPAELDAVLKGIKDGQSRTGELTPELQQEVNALAQARLSAKQAKAAGPYLAKAAAEKGAVRTDSGLVFIPISEGTGPSPAASDKVKVHYTGKLTDGKVFDSSVQRGQPAEFPLTGVIKCWTEGVQRMKVGGKARLVCPAAIAYGDRGAGGAIPPGATLDFEVELLEIVK